MPRPCVGERPSFARWLQKMDLECFQSRLEKLPPVSKCAFALCGACHQGCSLVSLEARPSPMDVIVRFRDEPGLMLPPCSHCEGGPFCVAHASKDIVGPCEVCSLYACVDHNSESLNALQWCPFPGCGGIACLGCRDFASCVACLGTVCAKHVEFDEEGYEECPLCKKRML